MSKDPPADAEAAVVLVGSTVCLLLVALASGGACAARWGPDAYSFGAWTGGSLYALGLVLARLGVYSLYKPRPGPPAGLLVGSADALRPSAALDRPRRTGFVGRLSHAFELVPVRMATAFLLTAPLSWSLIYLATAFHRPADWILFVGSSLPLSFLTYIKLDAWSAQGKIERPPVRGGRSLGSDGS